MTTISAEQAAQNSKGFFSRISSRIRTKLVLIMLAVTIIPILILSTLEFLSARNALDELAINELEAIRTLESQLIETFFTDIEREVRSLAANPAIVDGHAQLKAGFEEFDDPSYAASINQRIQDVRAFYVQEFAEEYAFRNDGETPDLAALTNGFDQDTIVLQHRYLAENEFPLGEKDGLIRAPGNTLYDEAHAAVHEFLQDTLNENGFYDIFIVDAESSKIIYSVFKETDYATSLSTGPYSESGIADAFRAGLAMEQAGEVAFIDYRAYVPSYEDPAAFMSSPIQRDGETVAVMIVQVPSDRLSALLLNDEGFLGRTGESFLVGPDRLWRTESRFTEEFNVDSAVLAPEYLYQLEEVDRALTGESGTDTHISYRGEEAVISWEPIVIQEATATQDEVIWTLIVEEDRAEIEEAANALLVQTAVAVLATIVAIFFISRWFANQFTRQIDAINETFDEYENENFDARVNVVANDELGTMAARVNASFDRIGDLVQTSDERDKLQQSVFSLLTEIADLAEGDLTVETTVDEGVIGSIADSINFLAENLRESFLRVNTAAEQLSVSANEIQANSEQLVEGSETQASQIIDTSAAVDEMSVSIQQVSENSALSATVGEQARVNAQRGAEAVRDTIDGMNRIRTQVQNTSKRIKRLGESTQEIDEMLALIRSITKRTSILALNASIQASRAGEAGRSFMVVAEEVEQLAERSAEAAKQIEGVVQSIQKETNEAVAAMEDTTREVVVGSQLANEAGSRLGEIETVSERLSELIQGISRAAQQQARGSETIARSMNEIAEVTQQTTTGTIDTSQSIGNLAQLAEELREAVGTFKIDEDEAVA